MVASARHFDRTPRSTPTQAATRTSPPPHLTRTMAHAVMSAVTVNASARPAAKVTGRSTMFAKRCETRKLAAQAATRSVQARAITEVTAESTDANSALYEEFKKLQATASPGKRNNYSNVKWGQVASMMQMADMALYF